MENFEAKCMQTTEHIADKILLLRMANKLTQEEFAEKVGLDVRTIARAESGKHRPSALTMEIISSTFQVPVSYFFDESKFKPDVSKTALIYEITNKLNVMSKSNLQKINDIIDII